MRTLSIFYGPSGGDFGLEEHAKEGKVVDVEGEFICQHTLIQFYLPFNFGNLDLKREHAGIRKPLPFYDFFSLLALAVSACVS